MTEWCLGLWPQTLSLYLRTDYALGFDPEHRPLMTDWLRLRHRPQTYPPSPLAFGNDPSYYMTQVRTYSSEHLYH
jgi:hypothetical protein